MELLDAVLLARIQFAFTITFHIIFPGLSIGLAAYLVVLEGLWLKTGKAVYLATFKYWLKIFSIIFGMGVVSGVVMSYQFGTNWSVFSDKTGPVLGPLMGYEVLSAFFLEAGFLGVMLFGMNKVGKGLHFFATLMVSIGTLMSAFWILSVNSWMQTPTGYDINEAGQFVVANWFEVIFNPSFPYRLAHMTTAAFLSTAFLVGGVGAWHLFQARKKGERNEVARLMFSMAMWMAALVAPLQLVIGDFHGLNTLEHQPAKVAAMEGNYQTQKGAPLYLFGMPNSETETVDYAIKIPKAASLILTHDPDGELVGLDQFPKDEWPNVPIVFWSFRIMLAIGMGMIAIGLWSLYLRARKKLYDSPMLLRVAIIFAPSGIIATVAGWFVTEVGRQPYTVYGLLKTADSASPLDAPAVATSLLAFMIVYFIVFGAGVWYTMRLMSKRPSQVIEVDDDSQTTVFLSNRVANKSDGITDGTKREGDQ
ncbi:cytochrome ubiquinol oxidase subunit I [Kangiella koreensis]|uniref:Cytochrome bd ubiquinol oxidase subunit I n=1 Tax=Kangiella koreensis (strain DSM 16069 / JCM 12317 / KCTC 12182 / SW-125) TaxID=523791 RepID=C7RCZ5_KANKD|nr:cytochrome ubiquinol oxidase subunit I [Kangiella koreensis]ACV27137.1 cytochrome bd ubiquinol oxidase subunit I [Kangiella koreensis DSM 16069]